MSAILDVAPAKPFAYQRPGDAAAAILGSDSCVATHPMALSEESGIDSLFGDFTARDLADFHVATHADIGLIEADWIDEDVPDLGPAGAKGIGEIGTSARRRLWPTPSTTPPASASRPPHTPRPADLTPRWLRGRRSPRGPRRRIVAVAGGGDGPCQPPAPEATGWQYCGDRSAGSVEPVEPSPCVPSVIGHFSGPL